MVYGQNMGHLIAKYKRSMRSVTGVTLRDQNRNDVFSKELGKVHYEWKKRRLQNNLRHWKNIAY
jgi:hypothetical protein